MSTYTAIAFDRFIEPGSAESMASMIESRNGSLNTWRVDGIDSRSSRVDRPRVGIPPNPKLDRVGSVPPNERIQRGVNIPTVPNSDMRNGSSGTTISDVDRRHHWTQISPSLYAIPEPTPLPDAPSSFPPSPYIINHKRRGPRLMKSFSEDDVGTYKLPNDETKVNEHCNAAEADLVSDGNDDSSASEELGVSTVDESVISTVPRDAEEKLLDGCQDDECGTSGSIKGSIDQNGVLRSVSCNLEQDVEVDDFVDPLDSMSVQSISENEIEAGTLRSLNSTAQAAEFYDAWEELSSESGPQLPMPDIENELREIRLSLLMEIEKRKQAEETLNNMRNQWQRIREQLSLVGLTLPEDPTTLSQGEHSSDAATYVCQQVYLARLVSNSIGRGMAKAEVEMEMEAQIRLKDFEIARLSDRLHYYETVNQEMSQRNQEVVESARRLRQRRKRRQRWVWGSIATAATIGSVAFAYFHFRNGKGSSSMTPSPTSEVNSKSN